MSDFFLPQMGEVLKDGVILALFADASGPGCGERAQRKMAVSRKRLVRVRLTPHRFYYLSRGAKEGLLALLARRVRPVPSAFIT